MINISHYIALAASIFLTVGSQLLLKIGARKNSSSMNLVTFTGLMSMGFVTLLMVYAMQTIELKTVIALSALTYVLMPLSAKLILKEEIMRRQMVGSTIILLGVFIFFSGS